MKNILIWFIEFYQKKISGLKKKAVCRFYPTCSEYARQSLIKYGVLKGSWLSIKRIAKCHPFNKGGYDPVK